mgnify:CR=1 FL=1
MERFLPYIAVAATAFVVTFVCTPAAKRLAIRLDAVDYPSKRRINTQPTPRLGGLAVFLGLLVAMVVAVFGGTHLGWPSVLASHPSLAVDYHLLAVAVLLMVATGTADDIVQLSPKAKFAGQIIAASVRNPIHVTDCALAGADIATVPYKVIEQMTHHPLTDQGIEKFKADYIKVFGE